MPESLPTALRCACKCYCEAVIPIRQYGYPATCTACMNAAIAGDPAHETVPKARRWPTLDVADLRESGGG